MGLFRLLSVVSFCLVLVSVQSFAAFEQTSMGVTLPLLTHLQASVSEDLEAVEPIAKAWDQELAAIPGKKQERQQRRIRRLELKLSKNLKKAEAAISQRIHNLSDAEVEAVWSSVHKTDVNTVAASDLREQLQQASVESLRASIPALAKKIVLNGGLVKFLVTSKLQLKKLNTQQTVSAVAHPHGLSQDDYEFWLLGSLGTGLVVAAILLGASTTAGLAIIPGVMALIVLSVALVKVGS